jgi:hypothetical protein
MPVSDFESLQALAIIDRGTLADEIRRAVQKYIDKRKNDPNSLAEFESAKERCIVLLDALGAAAESNEE